MFGLHKYLAKLYQIKWIFENENDKQYMEKLCSISFTKKDDAYIIDEIFYTYVDILYCLEECDFKIIKIGDDISLKIIKIK